MALEQIITPWMGTRRWATQLLGNWNSEDVTVHILPKHSLPKDVLDTIPQAWEQAMRKVGQEIGTENTDWRIASAQPYNKMEVRRGDSWALRMFAGDQTRIENYTVTQGGRLELMHSPANYAESIGTNNTDPWGIIAQYGRQGLADGHAVSVAITALDDQGREMIQYFKRSPGLGEYGGRIATAAGNSLKPEFTPFDVAYRESLEESRIIAALPGGVDTYRKSGLANSEFQTIEHLEGGGKKVHYLNRRGQEDVGLLTPLNARFNLVGLALNCDGEDSTPHHKSEYLFLVRTGLPLDALNDEKFGWTRNDEHTDVLYIPFSVDALTEFAAESFQDLMPPAHAVTLAAMRAVFGHDAFKRALEATNARYPISQDHPLATSIRAGHYRLETLASER